MTFDRFHQFHVPAQRYTATGCLINSNRGDWRGRQKWNSRPSWRLLFCFPCVFLWLAVQGGGHRIPADSNYNISRFPLRAGTEKLRVRFVHISRNCDSMADIWFVILHLNIPPEQHSMIRWWETETRYIFFLLFPFSWFALSVYHLFQSNITHTSLHICTCAQLTHTSFIEASKWYRIFVSEISFK